MTKEEMVHLLKTDVEGWNLWRNANRKTLLSLSGTDLSGVNLRRVKLDGADLRGASLEGSNLNAADLVGTNLIMADLSAANLKGAQLWDAHVALSNFHQADLSGAVLSRSDFANAKLVGANLSGAVLFATVFAGVDFKNVNFNEARLGGTFLLNADLSNATGLEGVWHVLPSIVDIGTIFTSAGKIPEPFLSKWTKVLSQRLPLYTGEITPFYRLHGGIYDWNPLPHCHHWVALCHKTFVHLLSWCRLSRRFYPLSALAIPCQGN